jgi:tetratricopeptide (TPR) repeat protein
MGQSALAINDYKIIIEQYGSTKSADKACFSLGRIYYDQQNYDSSLYYFNMYINDFGKADFLLTAAYGGAAKCLEEKADYSKAGEYYMKAAQIADNELFSPDYYMMAGRVYLKAGLIEQADQAYKQVVDNYKRSSQNTKAEKKLAEIKYRPDETH